MIVIMTTLIINVTDYDSNYIFSNHDYKHEYNEYHTNLYSLSYIYNTNITTK